MICYADAEETKDGGGAHNDARGDRMRVGD